MLAGNTEYQQLSGGVNLKWLQRGNDYVVPPFAKEEWSWSLYINFYFTSRPLPRHTHTHTRQIEHSRSWKNWKLSLLFVSDYPPCAFAERFFREEYKKYLHLIYETLFRYIKRWKIEYLIIFSLSGGLSSITHLFNLSETCFPKITRE